MAKYCTACGVELDEVYKFCPECGAGINQNENDENKRGEHEKLNRRMGEKDVIICDNCGDENPNGIKNCSGCGAVLRGKVIKKTTSEHNLHTQPKKEIKREIRSTSKKKTKKKQQNPKSENVNNSGSRQFDAKKIYLIAAVIIIFVIVVLFSSGVFESDETVSLSSNTGNEQSIGSGIDLNSLQQINELEAKVNANPDDFKLLLELAHLKNDSGFYENAITLYQRYLDKNPADADARIDMGVCFFNIGNYETAINEMKKALEYQPNHQIGHLNLGIVNLTAGNVEEAKSWFKKTIELGPDSEIGKKAKELLNSHSL